MNKKQKDKICKACDNILKAVYEVRYYEYKPTSDAWMNEWLDDMKYYAEVDRSDYEICQPMLVSCVDTEYKINEISLRTERVLGEIAFLTMGRITTRIYFREIADVYYFEHHFLKMREMIDLFYKKIPYAEFYKERNAEVFE